MSPATVDALFKALEKEIPDPSTELNFQTPFELLIAVILSAQATDISVNRITPDLFREASTPSEMADLGEERIRELIRRIGLANTKAKNIYRTCRQLMEKHHSKVPDTREELEALPGVGRKTAGVVLNTAFGREEIPVDTHVFRVANRTGLARARTTDETERQLQRVVPGRIKKKAHHLLILHGRHICKARKPLCFQCRISTFCEFTEKTEIAV